MTAAIVAIMAKSKIQSATGVCEQPQNGQMRGGSNNPQSRHFLLAIGISPLCSPSWRVGEIGRSRRPFSPFATNIATLRRAQPSALVSRYRDQYPAPRGACQSPFSSSSSKPANRTIVFGCALRTNSDTEAALPLRTANSAPGHLVFCASSANAFISSR